jgi:DNA replication protein DnaC
MRGLTEEAAAVAIDVATRVLRLPTVRASADELAAAAARDHVTHRAYLAELLASEVDDREARRRERRIAEARFPRIKRLAEFDLGATPSIAPGTLAALATGDWISAGEPVVLLGDSGTGKTHLLIGLGIAACEAGLRVRYVTAAALVNELVEAEDERELSKVVGRYGRLDLLCLDELGYLHLDRRGAELLFQVLTERDERASIGVTVTWNQPHRGRTRTSRRSARVCGWTPLAGRCSAALPRPSRGSRSGRTWAGRRARSRPTPVGSRTS